MGGWSLVYEEFSPENERLARDPLHSRKRVFLYPRSR